MGGSIETSHKTTVANKLPLGAITERNNEKELRNIIVIKY